MCCHQSDKLKVACNSRQELHRMLVCVRCENWIFLSVSCSIPILILNASYSSTWTLECSLSLKHWEFDISLHEYIVCCCFQRKMLISLNKRTPNKLYKLQKIKVASFFCLSLHYSLALWNNVCSFYTEHISLGISHLCDCCCCHHRRQLRH